MKIEKNNPNKMYLMSNDVAKAGQTFEQYIAYILEYSIHMLEISTNNISLCNIDNF